MRSFLKNQVKKQQITAFSFLFLRLRDDFKILQDGKVFRKTLTAGG